jgi:hypothetical protein
MTDTTLDLKQLKHPIHISSRLMAAVTVGSPDNVLHILAAGWDGEGRLRYDLVMERAQGKGRAVYDEKAALSSGVGQDIDYAAMFGTLLSFLLADAETYRRVALTPGENDEDTDYTFGADWAEWAYQFDNELQELDMDLNPDRYTDA